MQFRRLRCLPLIPPPARHDRHLIIQVGGRQRLSNHVRQRRSLIFAVLECNEWRLLFGVGNFRLLDRLLTQMDRIMRINNLAQVTKGVVNRQGKMSRCTKLGDYEKKASFAALNCGLAQQRYVKSTEIFLEGV